MIVKPWETISRFFRTSYAGHSFWMIGGQGGQAAVAFCSNLILVRYLSPKDFGLFALIQANIGLALSTFSFRINTILMQAAEGQLQSGRKDLYLSALVGQTILGFLSSLALLWFFGLWDVWAMILLVNMLTQPWIFAQGVLYERSFQYKNLSLVETGSHFVSHIFSIIGVVGGLGPGVLYLRGWVQFLGRLLGLAFVGGLQSFRVRWLSLDEWRFIIRQIRGYWLEGWLTQTFERLVILCLGLFEGKEMTGYFFQARRLAITPHQLLEPVASRVLFNFLSHKVSVLSGIKVLQQVLTLQIPFLVIIAAIAIIGADPMIPWIFGPGWEPVIPLFQGMVGVLIGMTPFHTLGAYFKAQNYMWPFIAFGQSFQYGAFGIALLIAVLLNLSIAYGMAVGLSVGYFGGFFVLTIALRFFRHRFKEKVKQYHETLDSV